MIIHAGADSLEHGFSGDHVPCRPVEEGCTDRVNVQLADQSKAVDGACGADGNSIHKGDEAQTIAQGEGNDTGRGQHGLGSHNDLIHLWVAELALSCADMSCCYCAHACRSSWSAGCLSAADWHAVQLLLHEGLRESAAGDGMVAKMKMAADVSKCIATVLRHMPLTYGWSAC